MGTETGGYSQPQKTYSGYFVKLNNPLMGTETRPSTLGGKIRYLDR